MERRVWEGKRLYCGCDGVEWECGVGRVPIDLDEDPCPDCDYFSWYYVNPEDEPKP